MSPPRKRARPNFTRGARGAKTALHLQAELDRERSGVHLKLKSKWEGIFDKFGRDFEGEADEIDLSTGKLVVDNGHLRGRKTDEEEADYLPEKDYLDVLTKNGTPRQRRRKIKADIKNEYQEREEEEDTEGNLVDELTDMAVTPRSLTRRKQLKSKAAGIAATTQDEMIEDSSSRKNQRLTATTENIMTSSVSLSSSKTAHPDDIVAGGNTDGQSEETIMKTFGAYGPALLDYYQKLTKGDDASSVRNDANVAPDGVDSEVLQGMLAGDAMDVDGKTSPEQNSVISDDSGLGQSKEANFALDVAMKPKAQTELSNAFEDSAVGFSAAQLSAIVPRTPIAKIVGQETMTTSISSFRRSPKKTPITYSKKDRRLSCTRFNFSKQSAADQTPARVSIWAPMPDDPFWDATWQDKHPDGEPAEAEFRKKLVMPKDMPVNDLSATPLVNDPGENPTKTSFKTIATPRKLFKKPTRKSLSALETPKSVPARRASVTATTAKTPQNVKKTPRSKIEEGSSTKSTPVRKTFLDFLKKKRPDGGDLSDDENQGLSALKDAPISVETDIYHPSQIVVDLKGRLTDAEAKKSNNVKVPADENNLLGNDVVEVRKRKHDDIIEPEVDVGEAQNSDLLQEVESPTNIKLAEGPTPEKSVEGFVIEDQSNHEVAEAATQELLATLLPLSTAEETLAEPLDSEVLVVPGLPSTVVAEQTMQPVQEFVVLETVKVELKCGDVGYRCEKTICMKCVEDWDD